MGGLAQGMAPRVLATSRQQLALMSGLRDVSRVPGGAWEPGGHPVTEVRTRRGRRRRRFFAEAAETRPFPSGRLGGYCDATRGSKSGLSGKLVRVGELG